MHCLYYLKVKSLPAKLPLVTLSLAETNNKCWLRLSVWDYVLYCNLRDNWKCDFDFIKFSFLVILYWEGRPKVQSVPFSRNPFHKILQNQVLLILLFKKRAKAFARFLKCKISKTLLCLEPRYGVWLFPQTAAFTQTVYFLQIRRNGFRQVGFGETGHQIQPNWEKLKN